MIQAVKSDDAQIGRNGLLQADLPICVQNRQFQPLYQLIAIRAQQGLTYISFIIVGSSCSETCNVRGHGLCVCHIGDDA